MLEVVQWHQQELVKFQPTMLVRSFTGWKEMVWKWQVVEELWSLFSLFSNVDPSVCPSIWPSIHHSYQNTDDSTIIAKKLSIQDVREKNYFCSSSAPCNRSCCDCGALMCGRSYNWKWNATVCSLPWLLITSFLFSIMKLQLMPKFIVVSSN